MLTFENMFDIIKIRTDVPNGMFGVYKEYLSYMREIQYLNKSERCKRIRNERLRQYRKVRQMKRFISLFIVLVICGFIFGSTESIASQTHDKEPVYKYYKSVCISDGDTLTSIADKYYTEDFKSKKKFVKEIRFINHLESDSIMAGGYIIVPYYSVNVK